MEHFEVTVRLLDVVEPDLATARRTVEERLRLGGFTRWQVLGVIKEGAEPAPLRHPVRGARMRPQPSYLGGKILTLVVVLWSLWLLWLIAG